MQTATRAEINDDLPDALISRANAWNSGKTELLIGSETHNLDFNVSLLLSIVLS